MTFERRAGESRKIGPVRRLNVGNVFARGSSMPMVESLREFEPQMTLEVFLQLLRCHQAALQSSLWSHDAPASARPALYLDKAEADAIIAELAKLLAEVAALRASSSRVTS